MAVTQGVPSAIQPLVTEGRLINPSWLAFLQALWRASLGGSLVEVTTSSSVSVGAVYGVKTSLGAFTLTMPLLSSTSPGQGLTVLDLDNFAGVNNITMAAGGADQFLLQTTTDTTLLIDLDGGKVEIYNDGATWRVLQDMPT